MQLPVIYRMTEECIDAQFHEVHCFDSLQCVCNNNYSETIPSGAFLVVYEKLSLEGRSSIIEEFEDFWSLIVLYKGRLCNIAGSDLCIEPMKD